jgi:hypothetical protein
VFPIDSSTLVSSARTSKQREVVAKSAQGQRSTLQRSGPASPTDIEKLIDSLVRTTPAAGYQPLLAHTDAKLYYKAGTSECQIDMLNDSDIMDTTSSLAPLEKWRRFLGQQLIRVDISYTARFLVFTC